MPASASSISLYKTDLNRLPCLTVVDAVNSHNGHHHINGDGKGAALASTT